MNLTVKLGSLETKQLSHHVFTTAPPQDDPAPAVQPKQCAPVMTHLEANFSGSNSAIHCGNSGANAEFEHLIEIAVVESTSPVHADERATHQSFNRAWIKCFDKLAPVWR